MNQSVTFSFTVSNDGNRDAQMLLYDALPDGLAYIPNSVVINGAPLPGENPVTGIHVGTVPIQSTVQIVFQAILVSIPASLQLSNQGTAQYSFQSLEGRTITGSLDSNIVILTVLPYYVSFVAEVSTNQTFAGDVITYMLTIANLGNVSLENLVVYLPLPLGVTFITGSVMIGEIYFPSIHPKDGIPIGTLLPGAIIIVRVNLRVGRVTGANPFTLQGELSYLIHGIQQSEPANALLVTVIQPEIKVSKSVDKLQATTGCILHYENVVNNTGDFALDATFKDVLPQGLQFLKGSVHVDGILHSNANPVEGIFLGTVRPHSAVTIAFGAIVLRPSGSTPVTVNNHASASFTFRLPDGRVVQQTVLSDNVTVEVVSADIKVLAQPEHHVVEPGEILSFDISIINNGSLAAELILTGWIQNKPVLDEGVVLIHNDYVQYHQGYPLGTIGPLQTLTFKYIAHVRTNLHHTIEEVTGSFLFSYHAQVEKCSDDGEVRSDYLTIIVDSGEE
ncbi:hypothetical protein P4H66_07355 [Paenibacillus dokdonensis]|uniref:DUF11 domain-containing protein n=1 Tax=Paenibacillus dokdonensis TaxID=2567944 RepID=A0ABU6GIW4_9BACL|nr:hypothetical protein [Paenibacillus dokdonensis]MEC0239676.1 hypothetical protein [Paenibacillus dokdonensis]